MRKGSYSEESVWMSIAMLAHLSRNPAILLKSSVTQLRVVIVGASMRTPPGESASRRQGPCCDSKRWTQLHTPSPPWTPSVRVDVEPRAPSDCQFRHWRACALWQSRPLQRCLHWTQRPWYANVRWHPSFTMGPQCPSQVCGSPATLSRVESARVCLGIPPRIAGCPCDCSQGPL